VKTRFQNVPFKFNLLRCTLAENGGELAESNNHDPSWLLALHTAANDSLRLIDYHPGGAVQVQLN
jgi:hypothetical protein